MLPNHSSYCLVGDGTTHQSRRGESHLSDTATFGNTKTEPTASLTNGNLRQQRHRDMLAAIEEWCHASGADRAYWRRLALYEIRQFRFLYLDPERAAFERAVLRSKERRATA